MMVMVPVGVSEASVLAMAKVPAANLSNSKTPAGPFQMTVLQSLLLFIVVGFLFFGGRLPVGEQKG